LVLVADRRLVDLKSGRSVDDEACKVVALGSQAVFGFTGLANVRPPPRGQTDLWLVDLLSPPPATLNEVAAAIRNGAVEVFGKISHLGPRAKRHTFVGAGWQSSGAQSDFEPFFVAISNAQDADGAWRERASQSFAQRTVTLAAGTSAVHVAGQPLEAGQRRELEQALQVPGNRDPRVIASLLAKAIRSTAGTNTAVGTGLLGVILPRDYATSNSGFVLHPVEPANGAGIALPPVSGPTAFYVPAASDAGVLYSPHLVTRTMSIADVHVRSKVLSADEIKRRYEEGLRKRQ
jgi:hypothetical protein